ncbi:Trp biosynthesis-associated membrane protein [Angustibacter sp. McL0619]|uniref:Trp biosynthesis-associated membrane protein n=1 Tax=Angustibacter sp. McL0619 TaxID=3415676 RepID=UPI003CF00332
MRAARLDGPGPAAVLAMVGGALGLLAASRPWVHAVVQDPVLGRTSVTASGRQAAAVVPAVALVALAGGVALLLARTLGRRVAGLLLVLAGAAQLAAALAVVRSPESGVSDVVARAVGAVGTTDVHVQVTGWPWLAVASGVLVAAAGALAVLRARHWEVRTTRYDPPGPPGSPAEDPAPEDAAAPDTWDALSRGEDPTR